MKITGTIPVQNGNVDGQIKWAHEQIEKIANGRDFEITTVRLKRVGRRGAYGITEHIWKAVINFTIAERNTMPEDQSPPPEEVEQNLATPMNEAAPGNLPAPDQPAAELANEEVAQARRDIEAALSSGDTTLDEVFVLSDNERDEATTHRVVGHMHIGAALMALPHIGEERVDEIINSAGLTRDRHIDTLGPDERNDLLDLVEAYE